MPPLTVGELQVILSGDTSRLDRDMDRIDNRAGKTEKVHTEAWKRTGITAGEALAAGVGAGVDKLTRDAQGKLRNSRGQFATEAEILAAGMQPAFKKGGEDSGGIFARGMHSGLVRNSPLIVAAIGGALVAGAPLILAGAAAMFAGVGAAAAAQTVEVRSAWTKLGKDIRDGAVADAAVLVPVYVDMAEQIGDAFQDMRPQLREAFADSAPLIQSTTDGLIALGQNAMPGLVRAIAAGGPVFDGLEDFLAATGTGVTGLLDGISSHGPAAGAVFTSLGAVVGNLLPILGELLGQGAELAADVLPAVAGATGLVLDVLQLLGPALPPIVAGFTAMKVIGAVSPMIASAAQSLALFSYNGGAAGKTAGMMSTAVAGFGRALPLAALGMAAFTLQTDENEDRISSWKDTLIQGGAAADVLREKAEAAKNASFIDNVGGAIFFQDLWDDDWSGNVVEDFDEAKKAADAYLDSLNPQALAAEKVKQATNSLAEVVDRYGASSPQAAAAAGDLTAAQEHQAQVNGELERAMHGVTSAMIEQANQALASIDAGFAYENSLNTMEDSQAALNALLASGTASTEDISRAQLQFAQDVVGAATAAGTMQASLSGLSEDSAEYARIMQEQTLAELLRLKDQMGGAFPAAAQATIDRLQASGVTMASTGVQAAAVRDRMNELGLSVTAIPGQKFVKIDAPTDKQRADIEALGYKVINLPNGDIYVAADTETANTAIDYAARPRKAIITTVVQGSVAPTLGSGPLRAGFASGGYTGDGPVDQVAGPVHRREFVVDAPNTARYRPLLEAVQSGNRQAASMLATAVAGPVGRASSASSGGATGTGSASVGGVTKQYNLHATVTQAITPREFINLQREAEALYG